MLLFISTVGENQGVFLVRVSSIHWIASGPALLGDCMHHLGSFHFDTDTHISWTDTTAITSLMDSTSLTTRIPTCLSRTR